MIPLESVKILYEDPWILVVVKPPGMASQPERSTAMDMVSYLKNYISRKEGQKNPYVAAVHRLDRPVGGVMVYARTPESASALSRQIAGRTVRKEYLAVVCGSPEKSEGVLEDWLLRNGKTNVSEVVPPGTLEGKLARLSYKILARNDQGYTLVSVHLETGRHHQIRVQMAAAKTPVAGDRRYGGGNAGNFRDIGLFSCKLSFKHPGTKKMMEFQAKPQWGPFLLFSDVFDISDHA
ncbi:23S rRNA pseudouridine1911/1915/1917 synthase [Catenibacillus scindens]|uniref:RNA pseudouridylate synthase n=1 Tax=Catenibacillus scindens TaxID=673271 RepID=A0A7W8H9X1_9FIRM|nr:23S rRNA pseudouridine1911/1915/1917 synthase [Catenibacillus scindens]